MRRCGDPDDGVPYCQWVVREIRDNEPVRVWCQLDGEYINAKTGDKDWTEAECRNGQ